MNNDGLAFFQVQSVIDPLERREARNRNGSGMPEIKRLGNVCDVSRGRRHICGVKAAFSDFPLVGINFVADLETANASTHCYYCSGSVRAQHDRKMRPAERPPAATHVGVPAPNPGSVQ